MKDRIPTKPNRKKITYDDGRVEYAKVEHADAPIEAGTPLNKATLLSDTTAAKLGLGAGATPDEAFGKLDGKFDTELAFAVELPIAVGTVVSYLNGNPNEICNSSRMDKQIMEFNKVSSISTQFLSSDTYVTAKVISSKYYFCLMKVTSGNISIIDTAVMDGQVNSITSSTISISTISSSRLIVVYSGGKSQMLSVVDNKLVLHPICSTHSVNSTETRVLSLNSEYAIIAYRSYSTSDAQLVKIGQDHSIIESGSAIALTISGSGNGFVQVCKKTDKEFLYEVRNGGLCTVGLVRVEGGNYLSKVGSIVNIGTSNNCNLTWGDIVCLSQSLALAVYYDGNNGIKQLVSINIAESGLTVGLRADLPYNSFEAKDFYGPGLVRYNDNSAILSVASSLSKSTIALFGVTVHPNTIAFSQHDYVNKYAELTGLVYDLPNRAGMIIANDAFIPFNGGMPAKMFFNSSYNAIAGVVSKVETPTKIIVKSFGVVSGLSGLEIGKKYYLISGGSMGVDTKITDTTNAKSLVDGTIPPLIGIAVNETTLLLRIGGI